MFHKIIFIFTVVSVSLFAVAVPSASPTQPGSQLTGENFSQELCIADSGNATGYDPQFEIVTPAGIVLNSADFKGFNLVKHTQSCGSNECNVTNPVTNQVRQIDGNETFYVLEYPIGSFPTTLPEQCVDISFALETSGTHVQLGTPLDIKATPIFALGETAVDDGTSIYGTTSTLTVDPNVFILKKSNNAQEAERATGPSYPIEATLHLDIAAGETIDHVVISDMLDPGMHFVSLDADGGCTVSLPASSPGGSLLFDCGTLTGVANVDKTIKYTYYIDQNNSGGTSVLPANGAHKLLTNSAEAVADLNGNPLPAAEANTTVTGKSITMYKSSDFNGSFAPPAGLSPGDPITYTLTMQTSDFFDHEHVVVTDILGDGQHLAANPVVNSYALSSGASGTVEAVNMTQCSTPNAADGTCEIEFRLSDQLLSDGHSGVIPNGETITIKFETIVDQNYTVINNQEPLAMGDEVTNNVTVQPDIPGVGTGTADGSSVSNVIDSEQFSKTIYAVNGVTPVSVPYEIHPGDTVTYRLKSVMPVDSFYEYNLTDFLPSPFFDATEITTDDGNYNGVPPAGHWSIGPDHSFNTPVLPVIKASDNSIVWPYSNSTNNHSGTTIDILFTVTATNAPMANDLNLANIATTQYKSASGSAQGSNGIIGIITQEPEVEITKSILSSSNPNSSIVPASTGFESMMDQVDANDTITYQIHLENSGAGVAYDINVTDRFSQNGIEGQGLHACVISNIDTNSTSMATGDLFAGIYSLDQLDANSYYNINYTCVVDQDANPGADIDNNATLRSYANTSGGPNFVHKDISSQTKLQLTHKMEIVKNIISTSIPATSGSSINQGEIVNFEINVTLGEGTYTNYALTDNTCTGLTLQSSSANVQIAGSTVTVLGTDASVDGNLSYACEKQATATGTNTATVTADLIGTKTANTNWTVVAPHITTSKRMNPRNVDAGDLVTITLNWTNDAAHPAYKCVIVDPLDTAVFDLTTIDDFSTPAGYTYSLVGNEVRYAYTGDLTQPCPNGPARFRVNVKSGVNTSANLVNEMSFQGGTLPDGHVGENNSSINGSMESNATARLNLRSPMRPVKILTATSENFTDPGDTHLNNTPAVAIGEVIDVQITYGFYEGTTLDVDLDERFLNGGRLVYVPGSMMISRSDANLTIEETDINTSLSGSPVGTFVSVDDSKLAITNTQVRVRLGDVINSNTTNGTAPVNLVLHFKVKVQNKSHVQAGALIRDRGRVRYRDSISNVMRSAQSPIRSARAYEPLPTITKTVNQSSVEVGTALTYTFKVCNDENNQSHNPNRATSGFDWIILDTLPDEILPDGSYTVDTGTTGAIVNVSIAGQELSGTVDRLDRGECISVDYGAEVQPTAHFSQILTNTVKFQTTSLPGLNGTAGVLSGLTLQNSGQLNGERIGDGSRGDINNYHGNDHAIVVLNEGILTKELVSAQMYYAIGEKVHYRIERGVPKGLSTHVVIQDTLPVGLEFNSSDVQIVVGAGMTVTHNPPVITQNGQVVSFDFGDLNATVLSGLKIDYNVTVANIATNQDGVRLDNDANATYDDPNHAGGTLTLIPVTPAQTVVVGEPNLFMQKRITAGAVKVQAGDTVSWEVMITNNGHTTAFANQWQETLPSHFAQISNAALVLHGTPAVRTGTTTSLLSADLNENNTTLSLPAFDLPVGSSMIITFDSIAQNSVVAGEIQTNNTDTKYQSLLTGGRGNSDCGDDDNDATLNNYCEAAHEDLVIDAGIHIDKHLQGSNDKFTIGDEVTYEMRLSFIEGNIANVVLTDALPAGLSYVSHSYHNGAPHMLFDHATAGINSGTDSNVIIDFGDVNNSTDGNRSNDYIDVELTVRIDNIVGNKDGDQPENGDTAGTEVTVVSDANNSAVTVPVPITITEPNLQVSKTVSPSDQALGDIVTYHISVSHTAASTADAWDINFTDTLDAGLNYISGSSTGTAVLQNGQNLTFSFSHLGVAESREITYQARIDTNAAVGADINNSLDTTYGSLPNANGTALGARNGLDGVGGVLNNYALYAQVSVTPNSNELNITKEVDWIDANGDGLISIGDHLEYNISINNPYAYSVGEVNVTDAVAVTTTYIPNTLVLSDILNGNSVNDSNTALMQAWISQLLAGETNYLTFQVEINATTAAETDINNTASVDSNKTVPTDSNTVHILTDQRGVSGIPQKQIIGSSESFTASPNVAVGEVITVELVFQFSGGKIKEVFLRDNFDPQQFSYVANSMRLERSSTDIHVTQFDLNSSFEPGNLGIAIDDSNITHDGNGFRLIMGDVHNDHYDMMHMTESLLMRFKLKVNNANSVQEGQQLNDHASIGFNKYHSDTNSSSLVEQNSSIVGVMVVEPNIEVTKTVNPISAKAGDTLTYRIKICNDESGTSAHATTGFDWEITDQLPDELDIVGDPQFNGSSIFNGRDMNVTIASIAPGHCEVIEYNVTVNGSADFEEEINNTVRATSTSLAGVMPDERTGIGTPLNDLYRTSTATLNIEKPGVIKAVVAQKPYYPIGDTVVYRMTLGFTGSTKDLQVIDHFPIGLKYIAGSARLRLPADTNVSHNPPLETQGAGNEMVFDIGDLNITTAGDLYLELNATVEDIVSNVDGVELNNSMDVKFMQPDTGLIDTIPAVAQPIKIGEPDLIVSKKITTDLSVPKSAGDMISYQIEIENNGTTTAYHVDWEDKLPLHTGEIQNPHQQLLFGTAYLTGTTTPIGDADFSISTVDDPEDKIVLQPFDLSAGAKMLVTFDTIIQPNVIPSETLINTTGATAQSLVSGGRKHDEGINGKKYASIAAVSFSINRLPIAVHGPCLHVTHYGANYGDLGANDILGDGTKAEHIWRVVTQSSHGSVIVDTNGTFVYRPEADYNGPDSFRYEIEDANGDKSQTDVCIDVDCASSQVSDGGDIFGIINMLIMILLSVIIGLYFVKRENHKGEVS